MAVVGSISKIKTTDGTVHDITGTTMAFVFEKKEADVNWKVGNFSGTTTKISGTTDDYQLNMQTS